MKTDSTGAVKCRYWYYPYGEPWSSTCSEKDARKFTDKERDPESGLDYFGARYYASLHGRFTSTDPVRVSWRRLVNPQVWNLYSYVGNNPVSLVDPSGEELVRLGQHTDEEIKSRKKEIDQQPEGTVFLRRRDEDSPVELVSDPYMVPDKP